MNREHGLKESRETTTPLKEVFMWNHELGKRAPIGKTLPLTGVLGLLLITTGLPTSLSAQGFLWLGVLPGGPQSGARAVAEDGSAVAGWAGAPSGGLFRAFRWTPSGGMQDLGTLGGISSEAFGISADGSVVVGYAVDSFDRPRAFRWTQATGLQDLGTLGGSGAGAYNISWDGSVIVGWAANSANAARAFRWTQSGGMQDLGTLGGVASEAFNCSPDASFIVGRSRNSANQWRAFRWSALYGMEDLGDLGGNWSEAWAVSPDGNAVVGRSRNVSNQFRAFLWGPPGFMIDLGTLGGNASEAFDIAGSIGVVVGRSRDANGQWRAFRWTADRGMENLQTLYAHVIGAGSELWEVKAITEDGRYLVGWGLNGASQLDEAFIIDTYEPLPPQGFSLLRGFVRSGQLSDLFSSDNQYLRLIPGFVLNQMEPPIQVVVRTTAPVTNPLQVTLVWEVAANVPNVEERVELYNFTKGQWSLVRQQFITQEDTRHQARIRLSGFVSPTGEIRMKLSYRAVGLVLFYPWEVRLDETSFALMR
jgi:probable HAF family extracellular repeat protein